MKTATVLDLRENFSMIESWLGEGEEVQIEKRGEPIAVLKALPRTGTKPLQMPDFEARRKAVRKPDFAARLKAIWGDRVFSEEEVRKMRQDEHDHERW